MNKISGIYHILNLINGKRYIGQSIDTRVRIRDHKNILIKNTHHNKYLQRSWNKYGADSFIFEVIDECDIKELNAKETHWIRFYNTVDKKYGYNDNEGGDSSSPSKETRKKISQSSKANNRISSKETREKISLAVTGKKKSAEHIQNMKGRIYTQETRDKMSKSHIGLTSGNKGSVGKISSEGLKSISEISAKWNLGEKSTLATIDNIKASEIVNLLNKKEIKVKEISKELNVSISIIYSIKSGTTWNHISGYPKRIYIRKVKEKNII